MPLAHPRPGGGAIGWVDGQHGGDKVTHRAGDVVGREPAYLVGRAAFSSQAEELGGVAVVDAHTPRELAHDQCEAEEVRADILAAASDALWRCISIGCDGGSLILVCSPRGGPGGPTRRSGGARRILRCSGSLAFAARLETKEEVLWLGQTIAEQHDLTLLTEKPPHRVDVTMAEDTGELAGFRGFYKGRGCGKGELCGSSCTEAVAIVTGVLEDLCEGPCGAGRVDELGS
jgi:hypothetical protein